MRRSGRAAATARLALSSRCARRSVRDRTRLAGAKRPPEPPTHHGRLRGARPRPATRRTRSPFAQRANRRTFRRQTTRGLGRARSSGLRKAEAQATGSAHPTRRPAVRSSPARSVRVSPRRRPAARSRHPGTPRRTRRTRRADSARAAHTFALPFTFSTHDRVAGSPAALPARQARVPPTRARRPRTRR